MENNFIQSLREWQTLAGAMLGVFLPIAFAFLINLIQKYIEKKNEHKESLCRIKVYTSQVMNDIGVILIDWARFIDGLREESTKTFDGKVGIFLTNFPLSIHVLYDEKLI